MAEKDDDKTYWGNHPYYAKDYGEDVCEKFAEFQSAIDDTGLDSLINRSWCQYHARDREGRGTTSEIEYGGDKGESVETRINEYRAIVKTKLALAIADDLVFQALARNDDSASLSAAIRAQKVLEYYKDRGGLLQARKDVAETAQVMSAGWVYASWDRTAGELEVVDEEDGSAAKYSGDIELQVFNIYETAYDRSSRDPRNPRWQIVRPKTNKFELAKLFPKYEEEILKQSHEHEVPVGKMYRYFECDEDHFLPYVVYFKPSLLTPYGRYSIVLPDQTVIHDYRNPYSRVPVFPLAPSFMLGDSKLPYGDEFDTLMPVELIQDVFSTLSSQVDASIPVIWSESPLEYGEVGPFAKLSGGSSEPKTIHMFRPSDHLYSAINQFRATAARLSQVNEAMMGDPNASSSGSKTAFQVSTGMSQQKGFTLELAYTMQQLATMIIEILRTHMEDERTVAITGKRGPAETVKFKRSDLDLVQSVVVKVADPMLDSPAGRQRLADIGAEKGWFNSPDEYITAFVTGSMAVMTGDNTDRTVLIKRENEQLQDAINSIPQELVQQANDVIKSAQGQDVSQQVAQLLDGKLDPQMLPSVCDTDRHRDHIEQHSFLTFDDSVRKSPLAKHLVEGHIMAHIMALTPGSPTFNYPVLMATGQQPLPNTNPGTGQPKVPMDAQPPAAEGLPEKPQGSPPKPPGMSGTVAGAAVPGQAPKLPSPPSNAGSGNAAPTPALEGAPVPPGARG